MIQWRQRTQVGVWGSMKMSEWYQMGSGSVSAQSPASSQAPSISLFTICCSQGDQASSKAAWNHSGTAEGLRGMALLESCSALAQEALRGGYSNLGVLSTESRWHLCM